VINALLNDPLFAGSVPAASLRSTPLGFIDVGARGVIHSVVAPLAGVTAVLGFEPDEAECTRLMSLQPHHPWARFDLDPLALAGTEGEKPFYVLAQPVNSSLLRPSADMARRYRIPGFEIARQILVRTRTLDSILFGDRATEGFWGEFLKLDTQGAELDIMQGAKRTLTERTVAAIVEVEFCPLYENQPMFPEVETYMRQFGFAFFGFRETSYRSAQLRHLLKQRGANWRERLFHADAIFFKDPLAPTKAVLSDRAAHVLFACAMLLGYYDFALDVALETWARGDEAAQVRALAEKYAQAPDQVKSD
jgi:FkbM family methyltransferase